MPACKMKVACWRDVILLVVLLLLPQIGLARTGDLESGLGRHEYGMLLDWIRDLGGGLHGASPQPVHGMGTGLVASMDLQVN